MNHPARSFPPFYTLQPNASTREKQLQLWAQCILSHFSAEGRGVMQPLADHEIFVNKELDRRLSPEGVLAVAEHLISRGNAEWLDDEHMGLRVMLESSSALAAEIYSHARDNHAFTTVYTLFELQSEESFLGVSCREVDPHLLLRALEVLESQGLCSLHRSDNADETGVKFIQR